MTQCRQTGRLSCPIESFCCLCGEFEIHIKGYYYKFKMRKRSLKYETRSPRGRTQISSVCSEYMHTNSSPHVQLYTFVHSSTTAIYRYVNVCIIWFFTLSIHHRLPHHWLLKIHHNKH